MLCPNNKQKTKLFLNASAARYAYNWAIAEEKTAYAHGFPFIQERELRKRFTKFKKTSSYRTEFNKASNDAMKQAIRDAVRTYERFFKGKAKPPRFKSARTAKPAFYQDTHTIKFTKTHVRIQNISDSKRRSRDVLNWIRLSEHDRIPTEAKYLNPRITYDGLNWWVSVGIELPDNPVSSQTDGIGIDLGVKDLAILSDGTVNPNLNKSKYLKRLKKRERRLQRSISRKFRMNNKIIKKGVRYKKTRSIIKAQKQLLKLTRRITNILKEHIRTSIKETVAKRPGFVVLEDLAVKNMLKNRKLSKAIAGQRLGMFRTMMQTACEAHGIILIIADRWFPSSKLCITCGNIKHDLTLKDRTYVCPICGNILDRDYQSAMNLKRYGERVFSRTMN